MKNETIYLYEDRRDVSLTAYILDDSVEMLNGGSRGAVLVCPGGAYLYCSDREGEPVAMSFAAMGYHAFVLRYSVYNENSGANTLDNIFPDPEKPWVEKPQICYPAQVREIGMALACIREHAKEWKINMEQVAICGFSAGAHNCSMYAVNYDRPLISDYLGEQGVRPAAVILGYALTDYTALPDPKTEGGPLYISMNRALTGIDGQVDEDLARRLSPCLQVSESTPPMFLWTTSEDQLVDPCQTLKMAMALSQHHVPYELHVFEHGPHGMVLGSYATAAGETHLDHRIAEWIIMADKWMRQRMIPAFSEDAACL